MKYIYGTGGLGFIGSNLVDKLIVDGHEVHVIDNAQKVAKEYINEKAYYYCIDISNTENKNKIIKIIEKADGVFHLAASISVKESTENPVKYELNNTVGLANMLFVQPKAILKDLFLAHHPLSTETLKYCHPKSLIK